MKFSELSPVIVAKSLSVANMLVVGSTLFVLSTSAHANWLVNWEAAAFLEYTDNVRLSDSNEEDDVVIEPSAAIRATHLGPKFDVDVGANTEYSGYSEGTIGNRNDANLDATVDWKIIPNLFVWNFQDNFSTEFPIDVRDAPNQQNTQNVNTFATGPTFTPRIFSHTSLNLQGRYINTQAERSRIDNDRWQGIAGIVRDINPNSTVSANYLYETVEFHEKTTDPSEFGNVDFDRNDYYFRYDLARPTLTIGAQLGYTYISRDQGPNKTSSGTNSSLNAAYTINSTSSVSLFLYDGFSDSTSDSLFGGEFGLGAGFGGVGGSSNIGTGEFGDIDLNVTGDTVDTQGATLNYAKSFGNLASNFQFFHREEEFDLVTTNDREVNGVIVGFTLPYGNATQFSLSSEYRTTEFDVDNRDSDDYLVQLGASQFLSRNWELESSIEYRERDSDIPNSDFDVTEIRIGLIYRNF